MRSHIKLTVCVCVKKRTDEQVKTSCSFWFKCIRVSNFKWKLNNNSTKKRKNNRHKQPKACLVHVQGQSSRRVSEVLLNLWKIKTGERRSDITQQWGGKKKPLGRHNWRKEQWRLVFHFAIRGIRKQLPAFPPHFVDEAAPAQQDASRAAAENERSHSRSWKKTSFHFARLINKSAANWWLRGLRVSTIQLRCFLGAPTAGFNFCWVFIYFIFSSLSSDFTGLEDLWRGRDLFVPWACFHTTATSQSKDCGKSQRRK